MSPLFKTLLTILLNVFSTLIVVVSLYTVERDLSQKAAEIEYERKQELYVERVETYLDSVTSYLSDVSETYEGVCHRDFIIHMRKELFNITGAIEFGVVEKKGKVGEIVCNSWGEDERVLVRAPKPHDGFLMTGPHTINSLQMPIYVIKKSEGDFEYNVVIKRDSLDDILLNDLGFSITNSRKVMLDTFAQSDHVRNIHYIVSPRDYSSSPSVFFIPLSILLFIVLYFLIIPKWVRAIDRTILRRKIKNHHYYNEYQPVIDVRKQEVFSIEVFLRSRDRINAKDSVDKIKDLDLSIEHTIIQIEQIENNFDDSFIKENSFQINISSRHLESKVFVKSLLKLDKRFRSRIILEVTEDENLMSMKKSIKAHMNILKTNGVRFAIDDFGVEYSGLSYLSEFSFDMIKTDKIFIEDKDKNTAILKSVFLLIKELGIICIAEGVETEEDAVKMQELGFYIHQGWYYAKSMRAEEVVAFRLND
ncbi:EAL domain-containing protein [Marinomonas sp. C2222]|uniref:EAL domain-containing protein n=1 Tax=Marinomonas sargassi TaxID=2984494 RepID=A0ABT2YPJ7_9GAMM|nr:EAL domain-containing protein [Marinomonas sargassi]MCV2401815.1 EAL domain-containing protein [Marinomonas sargassi]